MGIKITNNATTTIAVGITAADTSISLATGTGALFPTLTTGDYFYAVLEDAVNNYEIIKVTARAGDALTVVRAQEGTTALAFSAGSLIDLRMTAQTFYDYIAATVGTAVIDSFTGTGVQTAFTMSVAPTAIQQLVITVGGVVQTPTTDYTVSGTTLTFTTAPANGLKVLAFQFNPSSVLGGALQASNNLSDVPNKATARANLGLVIGTDVQAYDANTAKLNVAQQFSARQRTTPVTNNTLSFDLATGNDFYCTPTAGGTLTFTNITSGCKGEILLVNGSNYAIAKAATVKGSSTLLSTISATGRYRIAYSSLDGTNVDVTSSAALS